MERDNFYILLELPCDPPETDPEVIEKAISKKQSEWSKLRNHPTKGLQAQKCINLIPEIRRVMKDEALRAKEAEAARRILARDKERKYPEIDRHIDILMGKGHVTREEKIRLARVHGLDESEIQNRINARKNEKYHRIDQQITLRMAKGYLTESEIEKIAKRNSAKYEEVVKRVRCPVSKAEKSPETAVPKQLDRSVEKTIQENLKLLNKSSLYDFLGLPESADLKTLQQAASQKKKDLAKNSRKDAVATASNTLAGHCITIFKSEENRIAYDVSLARSKLAALDSDIDIAGINGSLRQEYFEILLKKAMDFGMEKEEAVRYIKDYCRRKKLTIESPPARKRKYLLASAAAAAVLLIIAAAGAFFYFQHRQEVVEAEFKQTIQEADSAGTPEEKIEILHGFISARKDNDSYGRYVDRAQDRMEEIKAGMEEEKFTGLNQEAEKLAEQGKYKEAADRYESYLQDGPPEKYGQKAEKQIQEMNKKIEARDFRRLEGVMIEGEPPEKIEELDRYMENHPDGPHLKEAEKMLSDISGEYYIYITRKLKECETQQDWSECARLCENYISRYDNSYSDQLETRLAGYEEKITQDRKFTALKNKAQQLGSDYQAAIEVYEDYLSAYPDAEFADRIREEISSLKQKKGEKQRKEKLRRLRVMVEQAGDRYTEGPEGVVRDRKTGLMWQLADTGLTNPDKCLDYEKAKNYVENLSTGGHNDWRLPTPEELAGLYKSQPPFPALEEKWYWSSESYSRYSDQNQEARRIVDTVDNSPGGNITPRDSNKCGTVRAVRD